MSLSAKSIHVAEHRVALMRGIVIQHPRMVELHASWDTLIESARLDPNGEKLCMPMIAPPGTGKTTATKEYVKRHNTESALEVGQIPILHVTLKAPATRKSLNQDILIAMEKFGIVTDPFKGTENVLQERVRKYLKASATKLLVIDEFHHLVLSQNENVARTVGETVKWMLITGVCPIVVSGTEEALKPFRANPQLVRRSISSVSLEPLDATKPSDKKLFMEFLAKYLREVERVGIATNATALLNGDIPACLLEVSKGTIGGTCGLLEAAARIMTYDQRDEFERSDLSSAADQFLVDHKYDRNPFRDGLKPLRIAA